MASQLSVAQKKQLVEYKIDFQKDGGKLPYKDQLAYCQQNFKQSPSESAISRIWQDREKWLHHKSDANPRGKRIRGAKWADLEKALALWITQVCFIFMCTLASQMFAAKTCFKIKCLSNLTE
jgi:hypothetical protein